jgi:hypothetical protein
VNAETLKALKGSIEKWERIVDGTGKDYGTKNCPLCEMFDTVVGCHPCPVGSCYGNPNSYYPEWKEHQMRKHNKPQFSYPLEVECSTCKRIAKAELRFLKSLLPKEATK